MIPLTVGAASPFRILCIGAHSDDIEIGCGGALLQLLKAHPSATVRWVVLSGDDAREKEARCAASLFLADTEHEITTRRFRDGFFPHSPELKEFFEELKQGVAPDVVFTHWRTDRHQDHRVVSDLTWNTFRDHLVLEYEIPKYDGGLTDPNVFVPLDPEIRAKKVDYLLRAFASQRSKRWFTRETFDALMRLRGIECASPTGYAEGFYGRKIIFAG
jgi:LmbE family N-acetylglucosaminyl deacetylase